ncbi:hypothetical protein RHGRI_017626 [Rhododendron griersonianum]|uniref:Uncharacterized protein n=1 Tax=Rhododendron griersonianum TaxID=479676 RepID=A0AAV6JYI0_9ERIC|nr:hypothetical protein RHGRI_017626 [Rhododendron griersonianum]
MSKTLSLSLSLHPLLTKSNNHPINFPEKLSPDVLEQMKAPHMNDGTPEIWSAAELDAADGLFEIKSASELEAAAGPQTNRSLSL